MDTVDRDLAAHMAGLDRDEDNEQLLDEVVEELTEDILDAMMTTADDFGQWACDIHSGSTNDKPLDVRALCAGCFDPKKHDADTLLIVACSASAPPSDRIAAMNEYGDRVRRVMRTQAIARAVKAAPAELRRRREEDEDAAVEAFA